MKYAYVWIMLLVFILMGFALNGTVEVIADYRNKKGYYCYPAVDKLNNVLYVVVYVVSLQEGVKHYVYSHAKSNQVIDNQIFFRQYFRFSHDGKYYFFATNKTIFIYSTLENKFINKITDYGGVFGGEWAYDSIHIYYVSTNNFVKRYNILTGRGQEILSIGDYNGSYLYLPKTVKDSNIIYFLKHIPDKSDSEYGQVIRYNLSTRKITELGVPKNDGIRLSYTVSPNNKILIYHGYTSLGLRVVDLQSRKTIDVIPIPKGSLDEPEYYYWQNDSLYVIFSFGNIIIKYTVPNQGADTNVSSVVDTNTLVKQLHEEGFRLYKQKRDREAVLKYEEALRYAENARLWYDYGNSLSNMEGRLLEAVEAYQKALLLGFEKKYLVYYNIACVYSRLNRISEAYENLHFAVMYGYKNYKHIEKDADLVNLRSDRGWEEWWRKVKSYGE